MPSVHKFILIPAERKMLAYQILLVELLDAHNLWPRRRFVSSIFLRPYVSEERLRRKRDHEPGLQLFPLLHTN